jgi:hypothetical protein
MRRLFLPLLAIAAFAASTPALASEDTQYWQTLQVGVQLPDNFKLSSETVFRTSDAKGFYEIEENIMAGYKLDKHVTLWLGYTHDPQFSHGNFTGLEHRIRQQVTIDNFALIGKVKLSGRVRLEERFRDGIAGTGWRLRPYIKASVPFIGKSTVSVTHESFLDLNTTSFQKVAGYERMRNAISVGVPLNKKISIDFGYLNQHGFVRNGPDTSDNVLTTGLSASF